MRYFNKARTSKEEAEADRANPSSLAIRGYSEVYWQSGPRQMVDSDGNTLWVNTFLEYYG